MISKIKLKNFRSHSNTELNLSDGINIICGDNDLGKSSILRALNWVAFNKPSGDSFIKHGKKSCSVSIDLDNISILRTKTKKGDNSYTLYENGKEINKFSAIGQNVPDEIKNILKIDEINIQNQQDKAFLLSESSGYISKYLNNLIGLDIIDRSLKKANSEIRSINAEIKKEEERLLKLNNDKEPLKNLNEQEKTYQNLSVINKELELLNKDEIKLTNIISSLEEINNNLSKFKNLDKNKKILLTFNQIYDDIKNHDKEIIQLTNLISDLSELNKKTKKINGDKIIKKYNDLLELSKELSNYKRTEIELTKTIFNYNTYEKNIKLLETNIQKNKKIFKEKFPQECPLCGVNKKEMKI